MYKEKIRGVFFCLAIFLLLSTFSTGLGAERPVKGERIKHVRVFFAEKQDVEYVAETTGSLAAEADTDISSEVDGVVSKIHFEEGDVVEAGDLLITLKDEEYRLKVQESEAKAAQAQANFIFAKRTLERMQELYEKGVISIQDYDDSELKFKQAEANLEDAKATLALAQKDLRDTKILAPISGIISKKMVDVGEYITEGDTKLLNIVNIDPIKVEFTVPEKYFPMVEIGSKVKVKVEAYPKEEFIGEIYFLNPKIRPETRRFECYARIENPEGKLKPGFFVIPQVVTARHPDAVIIPEEAVLTEEGISYYFLVEGQRVRKKTITPGIRLKYGMIEILDGISEGDPVVVRGQHILLDGDKVVSEPLKTSGKEIAKEEVK